MKHQIIRSPLNIEYLDDRYYHYYINLANINSIVFNAQHLHMYKYICIFVINDLETMK